MGWREQDFAELKATEAKIENTLEGLEGLLMRYPNSRCLFEAAAALELALDELQDYESFPSRHQGVVECEHSARGGLQWFRPVKPAKGGWQTLDGRPIPVDAEDFPVSFEVRRAKRKRPTP